MMEYSDITISNFIENSIGLNRVPRTTSSNRLTSTFKAGPTVAQLEVFFSSDYL